MAQQQHVYSFTIRPISTVEELRQVRDLEAEVWENDDPVPVHLTATAIKHGGMVLGAFMGNKLVGFQFSFAGFDGTKSYLCSHTLGIHVNYRMHGIGEALKWAQRMEAIKKGYDLITWTYDPLETVNGYLNIKKLGAVCSTYVENCYGEMPDILNAGIPSDRFQVDWWIQSERVSAILDRDGAARISAENDLHSDDQPVITVRKNEQGLPEPVECHLEPPSGSKRLLVPVPAFFQVIKKRNMELAHLWRRQTRLIFSHYFQAGWQVDDFVKCPTDEKDPHGTVHYYVLHPSCQ